jgi:hypothetical protein
MKKNKIVPGVQKVKPHTTVKLVIKTANVDRGMVPVVNWLNEFENVVTKFENVVTKFCCEGGKDPVGGDPYHPYVIFACDDPIDLMNIVNKLGHTGVVEIRPPYGVRLLDYCIRFIDKEHLKMFKKKL